MELRKLWRRAVPKFGAPTAFSLAAARSGRAEDHVRRIGLPFERSSKFKRAGSVDT